MFQEDFLHYIWQFQILQPHQMMLLEGQECQVLETGTLNFDAGPDFLNAVLKIDNVVWNGHIEIHKNASDWYKHHHDKDDAYNNVILHIVYENDLNIIFPFPTLVLKNKIPKSVINRYLTLYESPSEFIPCEKFIHSVPDITRTFWMERLMIERLSTKSDKMRVLLEKTNGNWEHSFWQFFFYSFGLKVNAHAFEILFDSISPSIFVKTKSNLTSLESLLYGQSSLLPKTNVSEYILKLKQEHKYLQSKFNLTPIAPVVWKFSKMRPSGFPTIRISQIARLISNSPSLFNDILAIDEIKQFYDLLNCSAFSFWDNHYTFRESSDKTSKKTLGKTHKAVIIANCFIPVIYLYGKTYKKDEYIDKAVNLYHKLAPEQNKITRKWHTLGMNHRHLGESQALIQLYKEYCQKKQCLSCAIGNHLLKQQL